MKALKKIGIVLVAIVALLAVIGLFLPSTMRSERTMVIKAPMDVILAQISDFNNWSKWSPWDKLDPAMKKEFYGEVGKVGHGYKWESQNSNVGKGSQTITALAPNDSIISDLQFEGMNPSVGFFYFKPAEGGVAVTWGFSSDVGYNLFFRYMGLMMDGMMGKVFEQGLTDLQKACDAAGATASTGAVYTVNEKNVDGMTFVSITDSVLSPSEIPAKYMVLFPELMGAVGKAKVNQVGAPFAIYHKFNPQGTVVFEVCIPVDKTISKQGRIKCKQVESQGVWWVDYYGAYDKMQPAWDALMKFVEKQPKEMQEKTGSPYEVYLTDPEVEKDTAKWHTEIHWPMLKPKYVEK